jgi:hypothetical protein
VRRLGAWLLVAGVTAACVSPGAQPERLAPAIALVGGRVQPSPDAPAIPEGVVLIEGGVYRKTS